MVKPILNNRSEFFCFFLFFFGGRGWGGGLTLLQILSKYILNFLKQVLGMRSQTFNDAVYGELGRVPLSVSRKERILNYWF